MTERIPKLPPLLERKIYKTGQTRGADDDVIFQNRVGRNSTVLIPLENYDDIFENIVDDFENGYIVLIKPEEYFENQNIQKIMKKNKIVLGENALIFYETRTQWIDYNPESHNLEIATSRKSPLKGQYVARVPATTSEGVEKINDGYNTSGLKGAGIRVYEYASSGTIEKCRLQLEYIYWHCFDSFEISVVQGMDDESIKIRKREIFKECQERKLDKKKELINKRVLNANEKCICPLCLEEVSANGFYDKLEQSKGRDVPDLTVTQINLFHIAELRTGEYNHKPYNVGWGHHHCNVVCKDASIENTLKWLKTILERNEKLNSVK